MLATAAPLPTDDGWGFEIKWDGMRLLAAVQDGHSTLFARSGLAYDSSFPELWGIGADLEVADAVLDGEVIALGGDHRPSFALLSKRMRTRNLTHARRLVASIPVTYMLFDVLVWDGDDLRSRPYVERRRLLESLRPPARTAIPPRMDDGRVAWTAAGDIGAEGLVAKRLDSGYQAGRSRDWRKIKTTRTVDLAVGGHLVTPADRMSLLVGEPGAHGLEYRGRVATGITPEVRRELLAELARHAAVHSPFVDPPAVAGVSWVYPQLVVEVAHAELTAANRLRHPRFVRLRPDKSAAEL